MANNKNLKPFDQLTEKEQREIARKGGKASVKARREKKAFREILDILLEEEDIDSNGEKSGLTKKEALAVTTIKIGLDDKAKPKDRLEAVKLIRDTIGEAPKEKVEVSSLGEQQSKVDELLKQLKGDVSGE